MKKWTLSSTLFLLLATANALAGQLSIPSEFEFLAVDGNTVNSSILSRKSFVDLSHGEHKVAMRFNDFYEDDITGSHGYIKSHPFIVSIFVDGTNNYQLNGLGNKFINEPTQYAKYPKIKISRIDNGKVVYSVTNTKFEEGSLFQEALGGQAKKDIKAYAVQQTTIHKIKASTQKLIEPTNSNQNLSLPVSNDEAINATERLQYWWSKADSESRERFFLWLQKQKIKK